MLKIGQLLVNLSLSFTKLFWKIKINARKMVGPDFTYFRIPSITLPDACGISNPKTLAMVEAMSF